MNNALVGITGNIFLHLCRLYKNCVAAEAVTYTEGHSTEEMVNLAVNSTTALF